MERHSLREDVSIFLSSSVFEFELERNDIGDFIRRYNDFVYDLGPRFRIVLCEDLSKAIQKVRMQDTYNAVLRECHFLYILVGKNVGKYIIEEFEVGVKSQLATGYPKISIWFKNTPDADETIEQFKQRIKEADFSYREFDHIDTVKLDMVCTLLQEWQILHSGRT